MHLHMSGLLAPLILRSVGDRQPEIDSFSAPFGPTPNAHIPDLQSSPFFAGVVRTFRSVVVSGRPEGLHYMHRWGVETA
jgi:hypothetical protein